MRYCCFYLLIGLSFSGFGQNYQFGDTLFVWNLDGTRIIRHPVEQRESLIQIEHGDPVEVVDKNLNSFPASEMVYELKVDGHWILVLFEDQIGYVFDGDLVNADPKIRFEKEKHEVLMQRFAGNRLGHSSITRTTKIKEKEYEIIDEVSTYAAGKYTYTPFDGCFDHTYEFWNRRFSEVYHLMMNLYSDRLEPENEYFAVRPKLKERIPGVLTFSGVEATPEILISFKKNGILEIYSYSCD